MSEWESEIDRMSKKERKREKGIHDWVIKWSSNQGISDQVIKQLSDQMIKWLSEWMIEWLSNRVSEWMIDWLCNWVNDCLSD